jgi:hypothetical protein
MFKLYRELGINSLALTKALDYQSGGLLPCYTKDLVNQAEQKWPREGVGGLVECKKLRCSIG